MPAARPPQPTSRPSRHAPPRLVALAVLVAGALLLGGACSAGGDGPPATTVPPRPGGVSRLGTTVPATSSPGGPAMTGTATISRFDVPATVACSPGAPAPLRADFATDGVRVRFTVDNQPVPGEPPTSGTTTIELPCDGAAHTIVLSAYDAAGKVTLQSRAVIAGEPDGDG